MVCGSILGVTLGVTIIYLGEAFDPVASLETIQAERCTPFLRGSDDVDRDPKSSGVRAIRSKQPARRLFRRLSGAKRCRAAGDGQYEHARFHLHLWHDRTVRQQRAEHPRRSFEQRVGTVGRVQPHMEVKIADTEGRTVPIGAQGELCFRGFMVMRGYWNDEARTHETIDEAGWLHSGDLGVMDADGFIRITGRSKDMVIRGGENIYPREVEEFLFRHPAVADVQGFGVPDDSLWRGTLRLDQAKGRRHGDRGRHPAFCRGQITHFKIPRYVRFVDEYPMTVTGKVQKFVMREMMTKELASTTTSAGFRNVE